MSDPFCALLSFHYERDFDLSSTLDKVFGVDRDDVLVFMDSGAFSALTQGVSIDLHDYARFLTKWRHELHLMANLDVIGHTADTAEAGWRNWRTLVGDYGLPILPIMHIGEPLEVLDRYLDAGEQYIALGGLVRTPWRVGAPWLVKAFQRAQGHAVFHGFGVSSWETQRNLPWFTVDHTTWIEGRQFGHFQLFDGRQRRRFVLARNESTSHVSQFNQLARRYGLDPVAIRATIRETGKERTKQILTLTARSVRAQDYFMRKRHGVIHHPSGDDTRWPPGLRTFFANNNRNDHTVARNALKGWTP